LSWNFTNVSPFNFWQQNRQFWWTEMHCSKSVSSTCFIGKCWTIFSALQLFYARSWAMSTSGNKRDDTAAQSALSLSITNTLTDCQVIDDQLTCELCRFLLTLRDIIFFCFFLWKTCLKRLTIIVFIKETHYFRHLC